MKATIEAKDLVRALDNALLFCPKKDPWDHALYTFHRDRVTIITSDSYATHRETCPAGVDPPPDYPESGKASRAGLEAILRRAKASPGEVTLTYISGVSLTYRDHLEGEDLEAPDLYQDADIGDSWDDINLSAFQELLDDRKEDHRETHRFMVDTNYLGKLRQLRAKPGIAADVWVFGDAPIFARKGPWSETVIQPIDRERHATKNGDGVLWGEK